MTQNICAVPIWSVMFLFSCACLGQQNLTYYKDIEPIIAKNCSTCHRPNQSAPFNLLTYDDVRNRGRFIASVTKSRYMPPWKADSEFQEYAYEKRLTSEEIETIQKWVDSGMSKGKSSNTQTVSEQVNPTADITVSMAEPFSVAVTNKDDYRFFSLPTNLAEDAFVTSVEFLPGNPKAVHHSRLMTDTTGNTRSIDGLSAEDPKIRYFDRHPPLDRFFYGWVPGNNRFNFPEGTGKKIFKNTDFILNIHYSPNSKPSTTDQSSVKLYFAKKPVQREVFSVTIEEDAISNPPFFLKANTKPIYYARLGPIPYDISLIAVLPHMHYLGKSIKAFAVTPDGDAVNLIKIDDWNFRWQSTYQFKKMLRVPKGSVFIVEATYDNTSENPDNQFSPPQDVSYGWASKSEMMNLILYYVIYEAGDENKPAY